LIDDKRYIGSSTDLKRRLQPYFNINYLNKNTSMRICRALLKYGYSNFCLEILEYCDQAPRRRIRREALALRAAAELLTREKYYFELFNPEYKICTEPGSNLGKTHLDPDPDQKKTKIKMSIARIGEKNPMFGVPKPIGSGNLAKAIKVLDKVTNETTYFNSINEAAQTLNIRQTNISQYLNRNQKKPYKGRYIFSIA
jgi:group I intron endonuclease